MRRAFTLIELLVAISIIGLLMSLILPAVMSARASARKAQCWNHLHNLSIAMRAEAGAAERFPAAGNIGPELPQGKPYHSWVVEILPWIEQNAIHDRWEYDTPFNEPPNRELGDTSIPVLACPSDMTSFGGAGNLSYVVNGGFGWTAPVDCPEMMHPADPSGPIMGSLDLNGNGVVCTPPGEPDGTPSDRRLYKQTGLFFMENWPKGSGTLRHHNLNGILDGATQTLMFAENVRAGVDPNEEDSNWASPYPWRNSFYVSAYVCKDATCKEGNVDYSRANDRTAEPYRFEAINAGLDQPEGEAPWPSSYHVGGVNVAFVDGHVTFLSAEVDGAVYAALVSPQGSRIEGPLAQPAITGAEF